MNSNELKNIISQGENTQVQFKICIDDAYKIATEMVAFSNSYGGKIIIGVDDKTGKIKGLSYPEIQQTNALLANAASDNVKPAILIHSDTVQIDGENLIVTTIAKGTDKPYKDNKGIIWVKNGADKRKVFSNTELRVMMQSCGTISADSDSVAGTSIKDIDIQTLKLFLLNRYEHELKDKGISGTSLQTLEIEDMVSAIDKNFTIEQLLANISILDNKGQLTLTGLLLLSKSIQRYCPVFTVKCVSFVGNTLGGTQFRDKLPDREIEGNLLTQYNAAISFITRNLKTVQVEKEFNTLGQLEIPLEVFVETITNALIHRNYYVNAPIRLFIFDNRIELHSPGILPDSVTEENIKEGISVPRNKLLFDNAKFLLPYTGIGSGIMRVLQNYDKISFKNNIVTEEFVITMVRDETLEEENGGVNENFEGVNIKNEGVNENFEGVNIENERINVENERVNIKNERVNDVFERVNIKNERVKNDLVQIYLFIEQNPLIKTTAIEQFNKKSNVTNRRYLKILKDNNLIEYFGSDKTGGYRIIDNNSKK